MNFTIQSVGKDENPAQAEALYVKGDKYQVHNVAMLGSGDALQIQADTRIYLSRSTVRGYGDNLLSYGAAFFKDCELISTYGPHGWPRNPSTNHGDVFVNSTFSLEGVGTSGDGHCDLARSPTSGVSFPYAEFVLIECKLDGIAPEGWGDVGPDRANVHFWEYNSVGLSDGKPVDISQRAAYSRQLRMPEDAETIANYSNPAYVLDGWMPELAPVILTQPEEMVTLATGERVELSVEVAAEPPPSYQWLKDGQPLASETGSSLTLDAAAPAVVGEYSVSIQNGVGMVTTRKTTVFADMSAAPASSAGAGAAPQGGSAGQQPGRGEAGKGGGGGAGMLAGNVAAAGEGSAPPSAGHAVSSEAGAAGFAQATERADTSSAADSKPASGGCSVGHAGLSPGNARLGSLTAGLLGLWLLLLRRRSRWWRGAEGHA